MDRQKTNSVFLPLGKVLSDKLQKFQNRAARIILGTDYRTSSDLVLGLLNWESLEERRFKRKAIIMHKVKNNDAPASITELFDIVSNSTNYNLRGANSKFVLPRPKNESLKKSFSFNGVKHWNSLPESLRKVKSLQTFRNQIKTVTLLDKA